MKKIITSIALSSIILSLTACASFDQTDSYNTVQANQVQRVVLATVVESRPVHLQAGSTGIGTLAGAGAGGLIGSQLGHGTGSVLAALALGGAGAIAGHFTEKAIGSDAGTELTLRVQDTNQLIVVAEKTDEVFKPGETVKIYQPVNQGTGSKVRVTH